MNAKDGSLNFLEARSDTLTTANSSKSPETVLFCNVEGRLKKWKEENTCSRCGITYENFQTLANHSCHPFRCNTCCTAFLYDFNLKLHQCEVQTDKKIELNMSCNFTTYESPILNSNSLLIQKSDYSRRRKRLCRGCQKEIAASYKKDYCRSCRLPESSSCFQRDRNLFTNSKIPLNDIDRSVDTHSITSDGDCKFTDLSHTKLNLSNSARKRKSIESVSGICSTKNIKDKSLLTKGSEIMYRSNREPLNLTKSPLQTDHKSIDISTCKKAVSLNLIKKRKSLDTDILVNGSTKNNSLVKIISKNPVKKISDFSRKKLVDSEVLVNCSSKNCSKIIKDEAVKTASVSSDFSECRSLNSKLCRNSEFPVNKRKRKSIDYSVLGRGPKAISSKNMEKDIKNKKELSVTSLTYKSETKRKKNNFLHLNFPNSHAKSVPVQDAFAAKRDITSWKHSLASMFSQNGEGNFLDKKKKNSKLHSTASTDLFKNSHKVVSCPIYSEEDIKIKKERLFPKKGKEGIPPKRSKFIENDCSKKINTDVANARTKIIPVKSKGESVHESRSKSCSVPELEVSESTLISAPERKKSPARYFTSKDRESDKSSNSKKSDVSNCETDVVKLECVLNVLPDEDSGVLLKIASKTDDNFRCPKCNKLFKKVKLASIHYMNCKSFKIKKKMLVSFNHIEWLCLLCHFHCNYLQDLTNHKKACIKSSKSESLTNYFLQNYSETCRFSCSKCNYSCLSAISFRRHSCEKEFQHMTNCYIGVTKLSKCDLFDANLSKYECPFCEIVFFNYVSYKRHYDRHKSNEILTTSNFVVVNGKTYAKQEIKNVIKKCQDLQTADDIIELYLQPISNIVSSTDSESGSIFRSFNLDVMIPGNLEKLLPAVAEKILVEKDKESTLDEVIAKSDFTSQSKPLDSCAPSDLQTSKSDIGLFDDMKTYLKDFGCKCFGIKKGNSAENKPCLKCLTEYLKKRGCYSTSVSKQNSACSTQDVQEYSKTASSSSNVSESTESAACSADTNTLFVPPILGEVLPIEISSVASYYQPASDNASLDVSSSEDNFLDVSEASAISNMSNVQSMCRSSSSDIFTGPVTVESNETVKRIDLIRLNCTQSVDNDAHNKLMESLMNLKSTFSSESKEYKEEDVSSKTLLSQVAVNEDTFPNLFDFFHGTEVPCVSDVIDGDNNLCLENDINSSSNLLTDSIQQQHIDSVLQSTEDNDVPFTLESEILADENCIDSADLVTIKLCCPFDKLVAVLVELEPCDYDVVAYINSSCNYPREVHFTWIIAPNVSYSAFISLKSDTFICNLCYDTISTLSLLDHFLSQHEEIMVIYVVLTNNL